MSFLTRKERTLINAISVNENIPADQRVKLIADIKYQARLRQDGWSRKVNVFLGVLADYKTDKIIVKLK